MSVIIIIAVIILAIVGIGYLASNKQPSGRQIDGIPLPPVKENETFDDIIAEMQYVADQKKLREERLNQKEK